jgi:hypothetical protein
MPFANCQRCGRLFHTFDPTLPEPQAGYWPNLTRGDEVHDFCLECLAMPRNRASNVGSPGAADTKPDVERRTDANRED